MAKHRRSASKSALEGMGGGIFLVGLGVLFLVDSISFWPWILVVIGLAGVPSSVANKGLWAGMQGLVWMVGLAILFTNPSMFFPGILIVIGLSIIAGALFQPPAVKKSKDKRKPKNRARLEIHFDDDDDYFDDEDDDRRGARPRNHAT